MENETNPTIQISKSALDSLIFFTFGAMMGENKDEDRFLLYRIIGKAFIDATNQGAFNSLISKDDPRKANIGKAKEEASKTLFTEILKYQEHKSKPDFNDWHQRICERIQECYANDFSKEFTYGNAQKVVNMTLKYLYLLSGVTENCGAEESELKKILVSIRNDSEYLHIPIDSYIIDEIWRESNKEDRRNLPRHQKDSVVKPKYEKDDYKHPSDYIKPWSTWNKCDYKSVRELIGRLLKKKNKDPLEWETEAWIAGAKRRRKQDDDGDKPYEEI